MSKTTFSFSWDGDKQKDITDAKIKKAILESALDLQQRSSDEAPVKDGDLRGDAGIDDSRLQADDFVLVGYNLPYALIQHERLDFEHPQGGKAKFLEDPFEKNAKKYIDHIAAAADKANS